jgi:hypothetical protein
VVRADIFDGASIPSKSHHYSLNSHKNSAIKEMLSINFNFSYINNISFNIQDFVSNYRLQIEFQ